MNEAENPVDSIAKNRDLVWIKTLEPDQLPEGRVMPVTCRHVTLCMTHFGGEYGALYNKCPHQGGPLGEGSIENGLLRCPWHGWDYDPVTGKAPGFDDGVAAYPVQICGARGWRVKDASELSDALDKALDYEGPGIVEIISDPELI